MACLQTISDTENVSFLPS